MPIVLHLGAEVFNTFAENLVEKERSILLTDSLRNASALCTGQGAGTFWVQPSVMSA
jgi:hypothetical protein